VKKQSTYRAPEDHRRDEETFGGWIAKQIAFWLGGPIGLVLACVVHGWALWPDRISVGCITVFVWLVWGAPSLGRRVLEAIGNRKHAHRYFPNEQDGLWAADVKRSAGRLFAAAGLVEPDRLDRARPGFVPRIIDDKPYAAGVEMRCDLPPGMHAADVAAKSAALQSAFRAPYLPEVLHGKHGAQAIIRWPRRNPLEGPSPHTAPITDSNNLWGEM
jgi:hypothetical protein